MKIKKKKIKEREAQYIAQANCRSQLWSAHAAARGRFYISKYFPPRGFKYSSHSPDDLRSAVNAGVINKQKYAHAGTQLSASEMGIKDS